MKSFRHWTTNSNYFYCYKKDCRHLKMVKKIWSLSISFPGIDIFHVIYTRGTEVSKSYSTTTPSLLCTENSTSRFKLFHKKVIFKMALSHWHLSLPLFFTSDLPASNKLSSHRALQIKKTSMLSQLELFSFKYCPVNDSHPRHVSQTSSSSSALDV